MGDGQIMPLTKETNRFSFIEKECRICKAAVWCSWEVITLDILAPLV
jgi:hypothetical protein